MQKLVVLISGRQGAGKTTLANEIMRRARSSATFPDTMPHDIRFAHPLYEIHNFALGLLKANDFALDVEKDGELLQMLGTDWARKKYGDDIWVELAKRTINKKCHQFKNTYSRHLFVISDCRFKNEFLAFPEALSVRLHCKEELRKARAESWRENTQHRSEIDLDDWDNKFEFQYHTDVNSVIVIADELTREISRRLGIK